MDKILLWHIMSKKAHTVETNSHSVYIVRQFERIVKQLSEYSSHTP